MGADEVAELRELSRGLDAEVHAFPHRHGRG